MKKRKNLSRSRRFPASEPRIYNSLLYKRIWAVLVLALLNVTLCFAQRLTPEQTGGVYYAYPIAPEAQAGELTIPEGFEVFYISHYGRHGSRWLPDEERYEWVNAQFADNSNLTPLGRDVKKRLKKIWKNARGNAGQLTTLGAKQHKGIARRMSENFPAAFAQGATISARSSIVPRCRASMLAFCETLKASSSFSVGSGSADATQPGFNFPSSTFNIETDARFMSYINHESAELKALSSKTKRQPNISTDRFIGSLFKDASKVSEPKKLLSELHTIASDMQDIPLKVSLWDIFTYEEMMAVHDANNERMTIINGDTPLNGGIPARSSIPLWENIEHEADSIIAADGHGASLRFGHDTALYRLLTLLDLSLPGHGMEQIIPMAANLQMVFAKNKAEDGTVGVCFLLNEKPVCISSLTILSQLQDTFFYRWDVVKDYMHEHIHRLEHLRQLSALNTMVGTAPANTRTAGLFGKGSEEHGQTLPAVLVPNGQTFWTPQTRDTEKKCVAPYYYTDTLFQGIRASHWLVGGCTQDYGSFTIAPLGGKLRLKAEERATRFSHDHETSHPYYYAVDLPDEQLRAELTGDSHAALLRITPLADGPIHLVVQHNSDEGEGTVEIDSINKVVYLQNPVHRIYQGWGERAGFSGHLVLHYTDEPVGFTMFDDRSRRFPASECKEKCQGVALTFYGRRGVPLTVSMATSFTGREGAEKNLTAEVFPFESMMWRNIHEWIARLHTIDVEDPDTARVNQFYGALYRASFLPREMSDVDFRYPLFANGAVAGPENVTCTMQKRYGDFSMWDTYRALHPLYNIIIPGTSAGMMQSLVDMYEEGGWLPIFPCWNSYTAAMIGDHCVSALADAYVKGITPFNAEKAYEAMLKNAMQQPDSYQDYCNGLGRRALQSYIKYGYIPLDDSVKEAFHQQEQTSRTLEYAYDDFCVAQLAKALGTDASQPLGADASKRQNNALGTDASQHQNIIAHHDDYDKLISRSRNWRNVINPNTGYADGRHADGTWENNTDITHRKPYITEGATCHYTWYVPHDIDGLIDLMGGKEAFTQKLDSMFTQGRYWHGNEPCHQIPWLFTLAGHPEKTRYWVRHILDTEYNDSPGGLSGNDDAGQMSAWQIFAFMGFYPVCPGTPVYVVGEPLFQRITINNPVGEPFIIDRADVEKLPLTITHDEIMKGGRLGRNK